MVVTRGLVAKGAAVVATALVAGGIAFALTGGGRGTGPSAAQAWIDDPVDGSVVPPGPVEIVAHAYDPSGTTQLTVLIDGVELETTVPADSGAVLVSAEWSWVPLGEGVYVIEVIGRGTDGAAGVPGRAVVEVATRLAPSDPDPGSSTTSSTAPTTTTTTTSTTTPTSTTTAPPCTPPPPILLGPEDESSFFGPSPEIDLSWSGWRGQPPSCPSSGYFVEVATDADFANVITSTNLAASTLEWAPPPETWGCNTTYHWRVWSKRSNGTLASVSVVFEFDVLCVT